MTSGRRRTQAATAPAVPPDLRLRGERPRVTRLSRKVLSPRCGVCPRSRGRARLRAPDPQQGRRAARNSQHPEYALRRGPGRAAEGLYRPTAPGAAARAAVAGRSRPADPQRRAAPTPMFRQRRPIPRQQRVRRRSRRRGLAVSSPRPISSRGLSGSPRPLRTDGERADAHAAGRCRLRAEHAGPQDRLP